MGCDSLGREHVDDKSADQMTPIHDLNACDIAVGKGKNKYFTCSKCAENDQVRMMRTSTRVFCNKWHIGFHVQVT